MSSSVVDDNQRLYSINLKDCIEAYTWKRFREKEGFFKSLRVSKRKHYVDIRWGYLQFKHKTTRFEQREGTLSGICQEQDVQLYVSDYENKTPTRQHYTFSATRETRASATVEVQENYTLEGHMNLEIDLAGFGKIGAGFNRSLSVTNTSGETFEKALTWEVNTEVIVRPWHKAKASLCVYESNAVYDFEVKTTVSIPEGHLPVAIRRKADDKIVWVLWITNITAIFDNDFMEVNNIKVVEEHLSDVNRIREDIELTTHGVCKMVSWKNQFVRVESDELPDMPENVRQALAIGIGKDDD
ncbi:hypothetical protein CHS0354_030547 [Potamilus streckersoni]|uniref:Uncharacterized protein n=1 Tax=Potamilus streckersoni TaxID=2493646 RepID=A0AAE0VHN9_9BIVA|nr:hypothetical protein CHS0354_030547 [Potamilus streckersoni]